MNIINLDNTTVHVNGVTRCIIASILLSQSALAFGQSIESKSEFEKQRAAFSAQFRQDAAAYQSQFRNDWQQYKSAIKQQWGYAEVSTAKKVVIYSEDKRMKVAVDYENNQLKAGLLNPSEPSTNALIDFTKQVLMRSSTDITNPRQATDSELSIAQSVGISNNDIPEVAATLVRNAQPVSVIEDAKETAVDIKRQAEKIRKQASIIDDAREKRKEQEFAEQLDKEQAQTNRIDPKEKNSTIKRLPISDSRVKRALRYQSFVNALAQQYSLSPSLIYAVMETESSFNPSAVSPIPAFGLMQIVPTTAGLDVNQRVYNKKSAPSKEELFDAQTNVVFGSAYLNLIMKRYFKKVTSFESQLYCTIAAYNTGPGNVAKTINQSDEMSLSKMATRVNTMKPQEVKVFLVENLPADETRRYIEKVLRAETFFRAQLAATTP